MLLCGSKQLGGEEGRVRIDDIRPLWDISEARGARLDFDCWHFALKEGYSTMRWLVALVLVVTGITGCGKGEPEKQPAESAPAAAKPLHPAGQAAHDFMTAVVKGDIDAATALLSPKSIEQFESQGIGFVNPGLGAAKFRIGEVEAETNDQAIVQCLLKGIDGESAAEEVICWSMRKVDNRWFVSGISFFDGDQRMTRDFENLPRPAPVQAVQPAAPAETAGAQQPPQTALQPGGYPVQ